MNKIFENDLDMDTLVLQDGVVRFYLDKIADEALGCWYCNKQPWQREEMTKEELYEYAEEMRLMLEKIYDLTQVDEIS